MTPTSRPKPPVEFLIALGAVAAATEANVAFDLRNLQPDQRRQGIIDKVQLTTRAAQSDVSQLMEEAGRFPTS